MRDHPVFRSHIINDSIVRQFHNPNIGIALPHTAADATIATIRNVFSYGFEEFVQNFRASLSEARQDQHIITPHCLVISDLSALGVTNGVPTIGYPALASLFVGKPYIRKRDHHLFHLSLSFDHRLINCASASSFLRDMKQHLRRPAAHSAR
jgi:pyruvate/2-oxoglutarate dehydrogenase complex dihydrolipoamide acyltransferase (E2) component